MDAICKELRCPICQDIYTIPILDMSCGHNFCKKCVQKTLDAQCGFQRQFVCTVCSKVTKLRGRGIEGIKRNLFAENMVQKVTAEAYRLVEGLRSNDLCFKHLEREDLYCLTDNQPICKNCHVFGAHLGHSAVRLEDIYKERKESFAKALENLADKCDRNAGLVGEMERNIKSLDDSKEFSQTYVKNVGESLIMEIQTKVATLMERIEVEGFNVYKQMQEGLQMLHEPGKLREEMVKHAEQSTTAHGFLKKEASLRARAEQLDTCPELKPHYVSHGKYIEKLLCGVNVKKQKGMEKSLVQKALKVLKHWKSDTTELDAAAYRNLDVMLRDCLCISGKAEEDSDNSVSWDIDSSDDEDPAEIWLPVDLEQKEQQGAESTA